jgi:hypothetical protein
MLYKLKSALLVFRTIIAIFEAGLLGLSKAFSMGTCPRIFVLGFFAGIAAGQSGIWNYQPITPDGRLKWIVANTIGPASLLGGGISAGWGTMLDHPTEYGTHWDGFAKRYGMRLTGVATSNIMEAGLGAFWGEDPRYFRDEGQPFGHRVRHVVKMTFLAEDRNGRTMPAYARFVAVSGGNFLSNTWRPDSEADTGHAVARIGLGFLGRMGGNAFHEFWPDVKQRVFKIGR